MTREQIKIAIVRGMEEYRLNNVGRLVEDYIADAIRDAPLASEQTVELRKELDRTKAFYGRMAEEYELCRKQLNAAANEKIELRKQLDAANAELEKHRSAPSTAELVEKTRATIPDDKSDFLSELSVLLNSHSMDNRTETPDFILANYLKACLSAYTVAVRDRNHWFGGKHA